MRPVWRLVKLGSGEMKETATSRRPLAMVPAGGVSPAGGGSTLKLAIVGQIGRAHV